MTAVISTMTTEGRNVEILVVVLIRNTTSSTMLQRSRLLLVNHFRTCVDINLSFPMHLNAD